MPCGTALLLLHSGLSGFRSGLFNCPFYFSLLPSGMLVWATLWLHVGFAQCYKRSSNIHSLMLC